MIFLGFILFLNSVQAFPNFLTAQEIEHGDWGGVTWDCFLTSQIKRMDCREWVDFDGSEKSDMDLVIETDNAIYSYGFNNAHRECRKIKKDMQDVLKNQKYFCMLGDDLGFDDFEIRQKAFKPTLGRVYKCLNTPIGKVGWFGEFGICLE